MNKNISQTVGVRIRPDNSNQHSFQYDKDSQTLKLKKEKSIVTQLYDRVFNPSLNNNDVQSDSLKFLISKFKKGRNATIFAFGQSGSGKTHTLQGNKEIEDGIIDIGMKDLFSSGDSKQNVSCYEIQNEKINDLLDTSDENLKIRENITNNTFQVENLAIKQISNQQEFLNFQNISKQNKTMGQSYVNDKSSRSHCILTVQGDNNNKMNFIDLAGSEILANSSDSGQQTETKAINMSLFNLKQVISALARGEPNINFRNSALTKLLKDSFVSQCYTFMLCTISPIYKHINMSLITLSVGHNAKQVSLIIDDSVVNYQKKPKHVIHEEQVKITKDKTQVNSKREEQPEPKQDIIEFKIKSGIQRIGIRSCIHNMNNSDVNVKTILLLHAHSSGCDSSDWNEYYGRLNNLGLNVIGIDFPGFGKSNGVKPSSRADSLSSNEDYSINGTFDNLIGQMIGKGLVSINNKLILMGYDYGANVSIHLAINHKMKKFTESLVIFHSSKIDIVEVECKTLILWVPTDQFHPLKNGVDLAKRIKNNKFIKLDTGIFSKTLSNNKGSQYSQAIPEISKYIKEYLLSNYDSNLIKNTINTPDVPDTTDYNTIDQEVKSSSSIDTFNFMHKDHESKLVFEEEIEEDEDDIAKRIMDSNIEIVNRFRQLLKDDKLNDYYHDYIQSGKEKTEAIKLFSSIPKIYPGMKFEDLVAYGIWDKLPNGQDDFRNNFNRMQKYRNIQVYAKVYSNINDEDFMRYKPNGRQLVTHKAILLDEVKSEFLVGIEISSNDDQKDDEIIVVNGFRFFKMLISRNKIFNLNYTTKFKIISKQKQLFEDNVQCDQNDLITKAKMLECALSLNIQTKKLDFNSNHHNDSSFLEIQQKCTESIQSIVNLIHCVQDGIDKKRIFSQNVGKLMYQGQGHCHYLASVAAAVLLPFAPILFFDISFRQGALLPNDKHNFSGEVKTTQDHTWTDITYYPSCKTFLFDSSFKYQNVPIDFVMNKFSAGFNFDKRVQCNGFEQNDKDIKKEGVGLIINETEVKYTNSDQINKQIDQ